MVTLAESFNVPKLVFSLVKWGNLVYLEGLLLGWKTMPVPHSSEYGLRGWKVPESEGGGRMGPSQERPLAAVVLKPEWSGVDHPEPFIAVLGPPSCLIIWSRWTENWHFECPGAAADDWSGDHTVRTWGCRWLSHEHAGAVDTSQSWAFGWFRGALLENAWMHFANTEFSISRIFPEIQES